MYSTKSRRRARRAFPVLPILIGLCLLFLLGILLFTLTQLKAAASNLPQEGGILPAAASVLKEPSKEERPWNLLLVNFEHPLPEGYSPSLTSVDGNGEQFDSRASGALEDMLEAMRGEGLSPLVCSAYRAQELQITLYQNHVQSWLDQGYSQEDAEQRASELVARPGTSEHELGLAADIVAVSNQLLDESQEQTEEQQWLMAHCQEYGFILRYPAGKTELTGVSYEPWHYRYVGEEAAKEIMSRGLCLEEYLKP